MRRPEFIRTINSYGLGHPATENNDWWNDLLGLKRVGSGRPRNYTNHQVRLVVAWQIIRDLCGEPGIYHGSLLRDAAEEIADHDEGWVVITEQTVNWTRWPTARVFDRGAVCIPVPSW